MVRLLMMLVATLVLGSAATGVEAAQESPTSSPPASECIAPTPTADTPAAMPIGTPIANEFESGIAAVSESEASLEQITPPPGTPAGADLLERIRAAEENLAGCFNADDYESFIALFTPKALLEELGLRDPNGTPEPDASHLILRAEIISVTGAQTHADGRVSADVVFTFEGTQMRARDIFVESDGWLLLDEIIELPLSPALMGTPEAINEATLQALSILGFAPGIDPGVTNVSTLGATVNLPPGETVVLVLGVFDYAVCGIGIRCFVPVPVEATWSVAPAGGAQIEPATGLLSIDSTTPGGVVFTVRAAIHGSAHIVEAEVRVFTPEAYPLVGLWREEAQLACDNGAELTPALPVEELVFASDGAFAVTWTPFESYVDYWGTYEVDLDLGTLDLTVTGGNDIPLDIDGQGRFELDASGRLILLDLWLGTPRSGTEPPNCGHRFVR